MLYLAGNTRFLRGNLMTSYKYLLFDLDGTLTESGPGITNGVRYALEKAGIRDADPGVLTQFIGPPLYLSFMRHFAMSEEEARALVPVYKEYYNKKGVYENEPYPGIPDMLRDLKAAGFRLAVASAKPQDMVETVIGHFQLGQYFDVLCGASDTGAPDTKKKSILAAISFFGAEKEEVLMIGDRKDDMDGASSVGIAAIAVSWGYAPEGELEETTASAIAATPAELARMLLS